MSPLIAAILSLAVPGLGQFALGKRPRGIAILALAAVTGYLIFWALITLKIALVLFAGYDTSWLWLLLLAFWGWNVFDAFQLARGGASPVWLGFLLPVLIIYIIGWHAIDANVDRLVTRFNDARRIFSAIFQPDVIERDAATGALRPSENFGDIVGRIKDGPAAAWQIALGLAQPGQSVPTLVAGKLVETIALGLMSTIFSVLLAVPLSFFAAHNVMARVPGGNAVYYVMRTLLNIVRAIDTFIWGIIIIVWVGLGPFAGLIALTIHSVAALGKLYSEEIEHIDPGPVEAVTATGANLLQVIRFAVVPQVIPSFLAYSLLRWDINMRSATVVGFVAGGGIGFFVVETIRKGGYEQYAAALWLVAAVIIVVDYVSARWRQRILEGDSKPSAGAGAPFFRSPRRMLSALALAVVFVYCWFVVEIDLRKLFDPGPTFMRVVSDFVSLDLSPSLLESVWRQMLITIFQALVATTIGGVAAVPFAFLGARNLTGRSPLSIWIYFIVRALFNVMRSIEALLYVVIFVFWVGIGSFAGALALAVTTFALIGKLFSEAIENIDPGPLEAIAATGATRLQTIMYAILPQIVPPFISYTIYQWDINVRISTIIGYAGGGGIGLLLNAYFGQLQYHKAGTVVALIVIVVTLMDFASAKIREKMV